MWQVSLDALAPAVAHLIRRRIALLIYMMFCLHATVEHSWVCWFPARRAAHAFILLFIWNMKYECTWISFCSLYDPFIACYVRSLQTLDWPWPRISLAFSRRLRMSLSRTVLVVRSEATEISMILKSTWVTLYLPNSGIWWVISQAAVCMPPDLQDLPTFHHLNYSEAFHIPH